MSDSSNNVEDKIQEALKAPANVGELQDADATGVAGSPGCGDAMQIWLKLREGEDGEKVIDKASFQSFGCETAIAVASVATGLLEGKKVSEAAELKGEDLSAPLGALPPMKIHCASLVEEALHQALNAGVEGASTPSSSETSTSKPQGETLLSSMNEAGGITPEPTKKKIVFDR